jgi:2-amino-4-hydroxy-6-hydroxymethyldihydropteridine diphosphokinase
VTNTVAELRAILTNLRVSTIHETEPVGVPGAQGLFLNAVVVGRYPQDAFELLRALMAIEQAHCRVRPYERAPRTLDLDLILFGSVCLNEPDLVVPHPRFRDRLFVLEPLAEIGGDLVDPVTGRTVTELLQACRARAGSAPRELEE